MLFSFVLLGHPLLPSETEASIHQEEIKLLPQARLEKKPGNAELLAFKRVIISREIACDQVFWEGWNFQNSSSLFVLVRTKDVKCLLGLLGHTVFCCGYKGHTAAKEGKASFLALVAHGI